MLMFHTHELIAPWQTEAWREQMGKSLRASAYLRIIENRFVSNESDFVEMDWWDACIDHGLSPALIDRELPVWFGVDASTKKDSTAIVGCTFDRETKKVRLVCHRIFQPSLKDPLNFETTVETSLLDFKRRFRMLRVYFDPWQMVSVGQRLRMAGVPMEEFPQTVENLTEASQNLYDLVKGRNLIIYVDAEIRMAISRAVAKETPRGWRIGKEKQTHKIDVVVALAQAALAAMRAGYARPPSVGRLAGSERRLALENRLRLAGLIREQGGYRT